MKIEILYYTPCQKIVLEGTYVSKSMEKGMDFPFCLLLFVSYRPSDGGPCTGGWGKIFGEPRVPFVDPSEVVFISKADGTAADA